MAGEGGGGSGLPVLLAFVSGAALAYLACKNSADAQSSPPQNPVEDAVPEALPSRPTVKSVDTDDGSTSSLTSAMRSSRGGRKKINVQRGILFKRRGFVGCALIPRRGVAVSGSVASAAPASLFKVRGEFSVTCRSVFGTCASAFSGGKERPKVDGGV